MYDTCWNVDLTFTEPELKSCWHGFILMISVLNRWTGDRVYCRESGAAVSRSWLSAVHQCGRICRKKVERDAGYWIHLSRVYWPFSLPDSSRRCSAWIAFEVFGIWQFCKSFSDTRKGYSRRKAPWPWGHSHAFPTSLQWNLRQSLETATHLGQIEVINCSYSLYLPIQWIIDTIHLTRMHTPNVYIYM